MVSRTSVLTFSGSVNGFKNLRLLVGVYLHVTRFLRLSVRRGLKGFIYDYPFSGSSRGSKYVM